MKTFLKYFKIFCLLLLCFLGFAFLSCFLPQKQIEYHVKRTLQQGDFTQEYPYIVTNNENCRLDNFTDALILNEAYHINSDNILQSMFLLKQNEFKESQSNTLKLAIEDKNQTLDNGYPRYWHGNTFLVRLFLTFSSYPRWRIFMYVISSLLFLLTCMRINKNLSTKEALIFATAFLSCNFFVMQFSIQFFPALCLSLLGALFVIKYHKSFSSVCTVAFVFGCLTIYFDLLTVPLLVLGTILTMWLLFSTKDKTITLKQGFYSIAGLSSFWFIGAILTWTSKWTLTYLTIDKHIFIDAKESLLLRTTANKDGVDFNRFEAISENFSYVHWAIVLVFALILIYFMIKRFNKKGYVNAILFFAIALLPYIWYLLAANHSMKHYWFTFRLQIVAVLGILFAINSFIKPNIKPTKKKSRN